MNPPFSMLDGVTRKIVQEGTYTILVMPHWPNEEWFGRIQQYVVRRHYYPAGKFIFERPGEAAGPTKWPVWCVLVNGAKKQEKKVQLEDLDDEEAPKKQPTAASRRRYRRRFKEEKLC